MSKEPRTYKTKSGRVLTEADLDGLVAEAERGYDVEGLARRPGRPRLGSGPATVVPVRMHLNLHAATKERAAAENTSLSELVRDAVRSYLATDVPTVTTRTRSGRVLSEKELDDLATDAETDYDVGAVRGGARLRTPGRAEVVPVRMPPELKAAVEQRAEAESTSVSEVVRAALRARLASGSAGSRELAALSSVVMDESDIERDPILGRAYHRDTCAAHVGELGDGTPVYCILEKGHDGDCAPLPEGL